MTSIASNASLTSITPMTGPHCPRHRAALSGGPVVWHCPDSDSDGGPYGHRVQAADLNRDFQARDSWPARVEAGVAA